MKQRSYNFQADLSDTPTRNSIHSLPFYIGLVVVVFLTLIFGLVFFVDGALPTPLTVQDEIIYPQSFITERATWDLKNLTNLGPRVAGGYTNEYLTVDYLQRRINSIIRDSHSSQNIELDVQLATGAYYLGATEGVINTYNRVQNIVVKVHGNSQLNKSILVNAHFDSVPTSPGGSDNGINVAALLEILRIFSKAHSKPHNNIIFLFNGAEETPLQASHGFITQHKWATECKFVVNLDACGSGGKIMLFQTSRRGADKMAEIYKNVPHPYAQSAGDEIFQSGIIPSDTDFRIFRDFGGLLGLDMAFIKDGYRYHTKYDDFLNIPLGSYQHVGDNTLALLKVLSNVSDVSEDFSNTQRAVYFDLFGLFFVSYSQQTAFVINIAVIMYSLALFIWTVWTFNLGKSKSTYKFLTITLGNILGSWLLAAIFVVLLATIIDLLGKSMSWYGHPWLLYGLYVIPTIGLSGCLMFFSNHETISLNVRCQLETHLVRLIWTAVVAFGVYFNIDSVYAIAIPVALQCVGSSIISLHAVIHSVRTWLIVYALFNIPGAINLMYQALITLSLFVPMTGRIGSDKNPDIIIGLMTFFFTLLVVSPWTVLTNSLRKAKYYFVALATVFLVFFVVIFTPQGFPYDGNNVNPTPQRQWILHTSRKFFNESGGLAKTNSGFFFLNMDRNSPRILRDHVKDLSRAVLLSDDCANYAGCALPLSHPKMMDIMEYSTWIPAGQPVIFEPVNCTIKSEYLSNTKLRYSLSVTGPDRMTFYLVPRDNITLTNISLVNEVKPSIRKFNGRPIYFILYQLGLETTVPFSFDFTIEIPEKFDDGPKVDVTVVGRYVHDDKMIKTPQFLNLLKQIPQWADVTPWVASYYLYAV